jgi:4-amino-4-deoxy-L-arabinose transferase-like glycosyltransferase
LRLPYKFLLAAPVLLLLYFYGLSRVGLIGPDEPRYAAIGREMARSGDWLTPRLWGAPWFEKPALLYWLIAAGNKLGLGPELAPRLPVAAISVLFLAFYFVWIRREFGRRPAWISTAMLATAGGWIAFSQVAVTDLPLAATFSAAILLALPWVRSGGRRGLVIGGVFLGLAVLAKGLVPLALALPLVWVGRRRLKDLALMAAACLLVALPWYAICWLENGQVFLDDFIWKHHFGRFVSSELQHVQPWWFFIPVILGFLFPWTPLIGTLRSVRWHDPRQQLLLLTVGFGFVFFSASTNKLPGYILPLLPSLTALIGISMAEHTPRWPTAASAALLCLVPAVAATLPDAIAHGLGDAEIRGFLDPAFWVALASVAGILALTILNRRTASFTATVTLAVAGILYLKWDMYPELDATATARPVWKRIAAAGSMLCPEQFDRAIRYGLNYYAGQELPQCDAGRYRKHDILDRDRVNREGKQ